MDKFLVRVLPIIMNTYIVIVIAFAYVGIDISIYDYWFSCSIMMGILLTVLCHVQGRYHCKWIRALCYNLIFVPSFTYYDAIYPLFDYAKSYIYFLCAEMSVVITSTIILAIIHFRKVKKVTKGRYEEIRPIECFRTRKDR